MTVSPVNSTAGNGHTDGHVDSIPSSTNCMLVSSPISDFLVYPAAIRRPKYQLASSAESIALLEEKKKKKEEEKRRRKLEREQKRLAKEEERKQKLEEREAKKAEQARWKEEQAKKKEEQAKKNEKQSKKKEQTKQGKDKYGGVKMNLPGESSHKTYPKRRHIEINQIKMFVLCVLGL